MKKVMFYYVLFGIAGLSWGFLLGTNQIKPTIQSKGFTVQMKPHIGDTSGTYELVIWEPKDQGMLNGDVVKVYSDLKKLNDNSYIGVYQNGSVVDTVGISMIKLYK